MFVWRSEAVFFIVFHCFSKSGIKCDIIFCMFYNLFIISPLQTACRVRLGHVGGSAATAERFALQRHLGKRLSALVLGL